MPLLLLPQLVLLLVPRLLLVHLTLRACHSSKAGASEEACTSCRRRPPRCARCGARRAWDTAAAPAPGRQWSPTLRLAFRTPSCTLAVPSAPAVTSAASSGTIAAKRTSTSAATAPPPVESGMGAAAGAGAPAAATESLAGRYGSAMANGGPASLPPLDAAEAPERVSSAPTKAPPGALTEAPSPRGGGGAGMPPSMTFHERT